MKNGVFRATNASRQALVDPGMSLIRWSSYIYNHVALMQLLFSVIRVCKGFLRSLVNTLVSFTISCLDTVVRVRVRTLVTCLDVPVRVTGCLVDLRNDLLSAPTRIQ